MTQTRKRTVGIGRDERTQLLCAKHLTIENDILIDVWDSPRVSSLSELSEGISRICSGHYSSIGLRSKGLDVYLNGRGTVYFHPLDRLEVDIVAKKIQHLGIQVTYLP